MSDWTAAWLDIYEQWEVDPVSEHDAEWADKLATMALLAGAACYEDGVHDAGAGGWRRLTESYRGEGDNCREVTQRAINDNQQTTNEPTRGLPWEPNWNTNDR